MGTKMPTANNPPSVVLSNVAIMRRGGNMTLAASAADCFRPVAVAGSCMGGLAHDKGRYHT